MKINNFHHSNSEVWIQRQAQSSVLSTHSFLLRQSGAIPSFDILQSSFDILQSSFVILIVIRHFFPRFQAGFYLGELIHVRVG